ncbi:glycosyltransferase [Verrucomicrobia bacterium]|nr:glycosyltransferase [Verrucomicrobiota bacterium]
MARYQARFAFCEPQLTSPPTTGLNLAIVIPVHDEPDLVNSLQCLHQCERPKSAVEVILVVNASSKASQDLRDRNERSIHEASQWIDQHQDSQMRYHLLHFPDLPPKHAGVGLARKIGMDEAAARLHQAGHLEEGIIACFDADCTCEANFLVENIRHFQRHPKSAACSTYFEHPLEGPLPSPLYDAAAAYELHLRYYVEALRSIGFPYAYHTIGSSMAVKPKSYLQHGGMNRKKAGEDFYFLQKLMLNAEVTELNRTTVFPSVRPSHRVPFGTGRAIQHVLDGTQQTTYPFQAFRDLSKLISEINQLQTIPNHFRKQRNDRLPKTINDFLELNKVDEATHEIAQNVREIQQFKKRFWQWFSGFRCMKFLNWITEETYPKVSVEIAAAEPQLLQRIGHTEKGSETVPKLLETYRAHQKCPH